MDTLIMVILAREVIAAQQDPREQLERVAILDPRAQLAILDPRAQLAILDPRAQLARVDHQQVLLPFGSV
jgi:hypothetical protein